MGLETAYKIYELQEKERREIRGAQKRIEEAKNLLNYHTEETKTYYQKQVKPLIIHTSGDNKSEKRFNRLSIGLIIFFLIIILFGIIGLVLLLTMLYSPIATGASDESRLSIIYVNNTKEPVIYHTTNNVTQILEKEIRTERIIQEQISDDAVDYANEIIDKYGEGNKKWKK